ncbi:MAG: hypothetical protein ACI379_13485 [Nocardioides sp.]|uniref:hypothetical protein n=1 Tax=Nocardioides sp. TaxID=35761 RepID=UPI003F092199
MAALALGLLSAAAAVLLHQLWWGLLLGVLVSLLLWWALPPRWWTRLAFALGWVVVAVVAAVPRGAGDYLVPANVLGYAFLVWSVVLVVVSVVFPGRRTDPGLSGQPA